MIRPISSSESIAKSTTSSEISVQFDETVTEHHNTWLGKTGTINKERSRTRYFRENKKERIQKLKAIRKSNQRCCFWQA